MSTINPICQTLNLVCQIDGTFLDTTICLHRTEKPRIYRSLNSVSKWKTRDLPSLKDGLDAGRTPKLLIFSLAALLAFDTVAADTDGRLLGRRPDGSLYPIHDDRNTVSAIQTETDEDVQRILSDTTLWGEDLSFLSEQVCVFLSAIRRDGPRTAVEALLRS